VKYLDHNARLRESFAFDTVHLHIADHSSKRSTTRPPSEETSPLVASSAIMGSTA